MSMQPVQTRPPFVLVHGGRHGGWCWRNVTTLLRAAGHDVYTLTLTGLGERSHLLRPDIGLDTHVEDIVGVFKYEDLNDAVLVSHSYGGMPSSGAMEQVADRVRSTVFVDSHIPCEGESLLDLAGPDIAAQVTKLVESQGEGWYLPPTDAAFWGLSDPAQIAWVNSKTTAQPFKTYTDPSGPTDRVWDHPGMFIECRPSMHMPDELARLHAHSEQHPQFIYRIIEDGGHEPMISNAEALAVLLLEAAEIG